MRHKIKDFDNYMISESGEIVSLSYMKYLPQNGGWFRTKEKILKPSIISTGYYAVVLINKNGRSHKTIHRLLAETFIPNPNNKCDVNHKDGNKLNNKLSNLEWCTRSENIIHAHRNSLFNPAKGEKNGNSKLTNHKVEEVFKLKNLGFSQDEIAKKMCVNQTTISNILLKKTWKLAVS